EKVDSLGLKDKVIFTGVRSDTSALLQAMDVFVMPSFHEGLPVTLVEAQAAGLPCVISTEISKEVEISKTIKWCKLKESVTDWSNVIADCKNITRLNSKKEIINAGYDIPNVAFKLELFYLEKSQI